MEGRVGEMLCSMSSSPQPWGPWYSATRVQLWMQSLKSKMACQLLELNAIIMVPLQGGDVYIHTHLRLIPIQVPLGVDHLMKLVIPRRVLLPLPPVKLSYQAPVPIKWLNSHSNENITKFLSLRTLLAGWYICILYMCVHDFAGGFKQNFAHQNLTSYNAVVSVYII